MSPPSRGAWIEIRDFVNGHTVDDVAPLAGAWIEISIIKLFDKLLSSPPSRGAWIEILRQVVICILTGVAPLAGGVD